MPLKGTGFLAIWHDIQPDGEDDYNRWHTQEHMPERLGVPGFERGRRGVDWSRDRHRYLTLYEGQSVDVFGSEAYRARLNAPSAWSQRTMPYFANFVRCACRTAVSLGKGVGGAMATVRLGLATDAAKAELSAASHTLAAGMLVLDGVTSVHIGLALPAVSNVKTSESELRKRTGEELFDAVVLVDGIGRRELERAMPRIDEMLAAQAGISARAAAVYDLAYLLTSDQA
jgi:hypothetical protein